MLVEASQVVKISSYLEYAFVLGGQTATRINIFWLSWGTLVALGNVTKSLLSGLDPEASKVGNASAIQELRPVYEEEKIILNPWLASFYIMWSFLIWVNSTKSTVAGEKHWLTLTAAAAAKSLQSYPTLCDPIDSSPPGSPIPEILQARTPNWSDHIFFLIESILYKGHPQVNKWQKRLYILGFRFSISPSIEYSGLISFRTDWFELPAVQGTLKSLLQHHCSKASILGRSAFYLIQLSYLYMTTGKTIALTKCTFAIKVMSLIFINMLTRFIIAFLPRSKHLLTSWLQSTTHMYKLRAYY